MKLHYLPAESQKRMLTLRHVVRIVRPVPIWLSMREVPLSAEHGKKLVTLIARASLFRAGFSRREPETNTRIGHLAPADDGPQF
jgi:hypothetical protein